MTEIWKLKGSARGATAALIVGLVLSGVGPARAQSFTNLNFESANVPNLPPGQAGGVTALDGFPGWTVFFPTGNGNVGHNGFSAGGAYISIQGPQWPSAEILEGNYTAYIVGSGMGPAASAYIAQTGLIPQNSESLIFYISPSPLAGFQVTFGGQNIPIVQLGAGSNYYIMGGDISEFAGETNELRFTALPGDGGFLDDIQFSINPIPEPGTWALLLCGAGVLLAARRSRREFNRRRLD